MVCLNRTLFSEYADFGMASFPRPLTAGGSRRPVVSQEDYRCQKCLQKGHFTYQCEGKRKYVERDSRTRQMLRSMKQKEEAAKLDMMRKSASSSEDRKKDKKKKKKKKSKDKRDSSTDSSDSDTSSSSSNTSSAPSLTEYFTLESEFISRGPRLPQGLPSYSQIVEGFSRLFPK
ncbi:zinc finger CCHC domain-containing protein 10 isoform X2 [Aplysia californica]|uniref:Zinc finger CCHC domain-containing protein 10 isoform X2 n=1 Tax=Aplysia californica TaxID=6500 RepID=A0ABM0JGA8_APLCA|nr:zinc finger CCHC domain-containing protein 10 isoform X2 [Aplysia californica]